MAVALDSVSPIEQPETVTVEQAARRLGLSRSLAYETAKRDGELLPGVPVLRVGRRLIVPRAALDRVLMVARDQIPAPIAS